MRTKPTEKNTDHWKPERMWVKDRVDSLWFNNNDQFDDNTIDATMKFLQNAKVKAAKKNFVDVVVEPEYDEGDHDNLPQTHLVVHGWRLETDAEYERRLTGERNRLKLEAENQVKKTQYYASAAYAERVKSFEDALASVKKK
jgi:hypothetical protein